MVLVTTGWIEIDTRIVRDTVRIGMKAEILSCMLINFLEWLIHIQKFKYNEFKKINGSPIIIIADLASME